MVSLWRWALLGAFVVGFLWLWERLGALLAPLKEVL